MSLLRRACLTFSQPYMTSLVWEMRVQRWMSDVLWPLYTQANVRASIPCPILFMRPGLQHRIIIKATRMRFRLTRTFSGGQMALSQIGSTIWTPRNFCQCPSKISSHQLIKDPQLRPFLRRENDNFWCLIDSYPLILTLAVKNLKYEVYLWNCENFNIFKFNLRINR